MAPSGAGRPLIRADAVLGVVFARVTSPTIIIATASATGCTGPLDPAGRAAEALAQAAVQNAELPLTLA